MCKSKQDQRVHVGRGMAGQENARLAILRALLRLFCAGVVSVMLGGVVVWATDPLPDPDVEDNPNPCVDCPCDDPPPPLPPESDSGGGGGRDCVPLPDTGSPGTTGEPIYVYRGAVLESEKDLAVSGPVDALSWYHKRDYDSLRIDSGGSEIGTRTGVRWTSGSLGPYLVYDPNGGLSGGGGMGGVAPGSVKVFFGASTLREFIGPGPNFSPPDDFQGSLTNSGTGVDEEYTLVDEDHGDVYVFYGQNVDIDPQNRGRLKEKSTREYLAAGLSGIQYAYNTDGSLSQVTTAEPQSWTINYTYLATGTESGRLEKVEGKNASNVVVAKVEYTYFGDVSGGSADLGATGDLVQVKVSRIATDGTNWISRYTQYRYHNSSSSTGSPHQLKLVLESDAIERVNTAGNATVDTPDELLLQDDDYVVTGSNSIEDYANRSFTYYMSDLDTSGSITTDWGSENLNSKYGGVNLVEYNSTAYGRVKSERVNGSCSSCSGSGAAGTTMTYYYITLNGVGAGTVPSDVVRLVIEDTVDSSSTPLYRRIWGINNDAYTLRIVLIEDPTASTLKAWCESSLMDANLRVTERRHSSAHTVVDTTSEVASFLNPTSGSNDSATLNSSDGVIEVFEYDSNNRHSGTKIKKGSSGTAYYTRAIDYGNGTTLPNYLQIATYAYPTQTTTRSAGIQTTYGYTFWDSNKKQIKKVTATGPAISSSQNGSGTSAVTEVYYDQLGRQRWTKDALGYVNYSSYHPETGEIAYQAIDVNPSSMPTSATGNDTKWVPVTEDGDGNGTYDSSAIPTRSGSISTALALVATVEYDDLARKRCVTQPSGAKHCYVYGPTRTMLFPYWDSTGGKSTLPTQVVSLDDGGRRTETYSVRASYTAISAASGLPTGFSTEPSQSDYVTWTRYTYDSLTNKPATIDLYDDIPASGTGTLSTNFDRTVLKFNDLGLQSYLIRSVSGTSTSSGVEQVVQYVYDAPGRLTEVKLGVSNASHDMGSSYSTYPTMTTVSKRIIDDSGVGDGYITKLLKYHGTGSSDYTGAKYHRTYRGHLRGVEPIYHNGSSETSTGPFAAMDVDWRGLTTAQGTFKSNLTWSTVLTGDGYSAYASSTATNRGRLTETSYDDLGRAYRSNSYSIDSSTGAKGSSLQTDAFRDLAGQVVALGDLTGGVAKERAYDAAGRLYQMRDVLQLESTKFSSGAFNYRDPQPNPTFSSMSGGDDQVIALLHSVFDTSGNATEQHALEMNHDDSTLGVDLTGNDDYVRNTTYQWFDGADRISTSAAYGSGDTASGAGNWKYAAVPTRPSSAPTSSSSTALVTTIGYHADSGLRSRLTGPQQPSAFAFAMSGGGGGGSNAPNVLGGSGGGGGGGGEFASTIPVGRNTAFFQDDQGRQTWAAENFDDFTPTNLSTIADGSDPSKDRVSYAEYNGLGNVVKVIAYNSVQDTLYLYEDTVNANLVTNVIYPDSSDTTSSGSDQVKMTYNLDGSLATRTDQRGTVMTYGYDALRRPQSQQATTLGGSTDGTVRSITAGFDTLGRVAKVTSHGNLTGDPDNTTSVLNQIVYTYSDLSLVTKSEQSHSGVVSSSPSVQYAYDTSAASSIFDDSARTESITYPNGRVLFTDFGTADGLYDRLSISQRLRETNISGTILAEYSATGMGRAVIVDLQQPDLKLDRFGGTSGTYAGMDRFGRVIDQHWYDYTSGTADRVRQYFGYDTNSNRQWKEDTVAATNSVNLDEYSTFDGLDRLTGIDRGDINSGHTAITTLTFSQDYSLDKLNNLTSFQEDSNGDTSLDINQSRSHNDANEVTALDSSSTYVAHDAAGNMTTAPQPGSWSSAYSLTWDAWNRLVKVVDGSTTKAEYKYDGKNRRIAKLVYSGGSLSYTDHFYLSEQDQTLEVRRDSSTNALRQYTWGDRYVDDLVQRQRDTDSNGTLDETLYPLQDSGWNVVALADTSGTIVERFGYDPYGKSRVLEGDFSNDPDGLSDYAWDYRFTSRVFDSETGLHYFRARYYHDGLGRFIGRDPLSYIDGGSLYAGYFVPDGVDPWGLDGEVPPVTCNPWTWPGIRTVPWRMGGYSFAPPDDVPIAPNVGPDGLPLGNGTWTSGSGGTWRGQSYAQAGATAGALVNQMAQEAAATAAAEAAQNAGNIGGGKGRGRGSGGRGSGGAGAGGGAGGGGRGFPPGGRPPNMTPPGAGRSGAFNAAKRNSGIPTSQQPSRVLPNVDRRGNPQPGRIYEFDVPSQGGGTRTVRIRDDAGGHYYGPNNPQNRGPHFNCESGHHYDY